MPLLDVIGRFWIGIFGMKVYIFEWTAWENDSVGPKPWETGGGGSW